MPIGLYFPTCIYHDRITLGAEVNKTLVDYLYCARDQKNKPFRSMSDNGFTSFNSNDHLHEEKPFVPLFRAVIDHVARYAHEQGADLAAAQPYYMNSWGNIYPHGEFVRQHNHANAVISGVYYLSCPPGTGGTYFVNPLEYAKALDFPQYAERNMKNFEEVYFEEEADRLLLFPGWLKHYTEANRSDRDRVIISFNVGMAPTRKPPA